MSFELALRDAGIEKQNLGARSSIYPTSCKIIPTKKDGLPKLKPGQITFVVLAEAATDEPNRLDLRRHRPGHSQESCPRLHRRASWLWNDRKEDGRSRARISAATMLATTLGIPFDADKAWDEREQQYKMSGEIVKTRPFVQTAEGDKTGLWTSVISAVVLIL